MSTMFQRAYAFNGNISAWDTSKVYQMKNMFLEARRFDGDLSSWARNTPRIFAYRTDAEIRDYLGYQGFTSAKNTTTDMESHADHSTPFMFGIVPLLALLIIMLF